MRDHRRSRPTTPPRLVAAAAVCLAAALAAAARAGEPPATDAPVLHLANGGFMPGEVKDVDRPGVLRWQGRDFTSPFEFALGAVGSVQWPPAPGAPKADAT